MRHDGFRKWANFIHMEMDAQELNETGPVTEQVFEANRLIKNLKDFMRTEGYPEEQIKKIIEEVQFKEEHKIHYVVQRWKMY